MGAQTSGIKVRLIPEFSSVLSRLQNADSDRIYDFIDHVEQYGVTGLPGRFKQSDNVPFDHAQFIAQCRLAQQHSLWHYHVGIPKYDKSKRQGDWTSEFIVHCKYDVLSLTLLKLDRHPPFRLPGQYLLSKL